jgi:hypothetical protein
VVPSKQSVLLGWVTLRVTFGDVTNYLIETLTCEVVNFLGPYHIILGQPCYVKFMAVPSYAYVKLKIHEPTGVITVEAKMHRELDGEQDSFELAAVVVPTAEQREFSLHVPTAPLSPTMPPTSDIFKMDEDAMAVQNDVGDPANTVQIGANLDPK